MQMSATYESLEFRVALLERAMAENTRQMGELARALARLGLAGALPAIENSSLQTITIDADAVSPFAAGFHRRETDATGRHYRWTGKADFFELRFALDRNAPWNFEMTLMGNDHVNLTLLRAFVDYAEIPIGINSLTGVVHGSIPKRLFANLVTLTFHLPARFVPSELDASSPDHRSLSAVFYKIEIIPADARASPELVAGDEASSLGGLQEAAETK
jgi:hypothetical protein